MADKMRWRYEDANRVTAAVDSSTIIEIGDLVWLDTDDVKPASDVSYSGGLAATQETFQTKFLGVAM
jgi:hypothetical protein